MRIPVFIFATMLCASHAFSQEIHQNEPLIFADKPNAGIAIAEQWYPERWRISPQIAHDTLNVSLFAKSEDFAFKTDRDSITFALRGGETKSFYVKLGDSAPAHTVIAAKPFIWDAISYSNTASKNALRIYYQDGKSKYFDSLRNQYPIDEIIRNDRTDIEKVLSILNWTHHQWKHDGGNTPKGSDGLAILNEAKAGGRFPCFAYAIVLRDQLITQGYKARVLYLKTKDAASRKGSPGHVVTEVYLNDQHKWVFVDGQFNVLPTLNGKPLNAVEFQHALSTDYEHVVLASRDKVSKRGYIEFVYDYLYYLDTSFDHRRLPLTQRVEVDGMKSLMLVPVAAPNLEKIDFWQSKVDYCVYTKSLNDFYGKP
jgi:hypothetical protein